MIAGELVDARVRFEHADGIGGEDVVDQLAAGALGDRAGQHARRAVGQHDPALARVGEGLERRRGVGESAQAEIVLHQLGPQRRFGDVERVHGVVERFARHPPEVVIGPHQAAQPGVVELFAPPERVQRALLVRADLVRRAMGGGIEVEQRAVSVEDAMGDVGVGR